MHLQNVSHPQTERSLSRLTNDSKLLCHSIKKRPPSFVPREKLTLKNSNFNLSTRAVAPESVPYS